jgi:hypothetical protein
VEQQRSDAADQKSLDRRGVVLAAAAAVSGAALAKLVDADEAKASHDTNIAYDSQTVVHSDVTNTTSGSTRVSSNISGTAAFVVLNNYPVGISRPDGLLGRTTYTTSNCAGVAGASEAAAGGIGVLGTANNATGVGVFGFSGSSVPFEVPSPGSGVVGRGATRGVSGESANGTGVYGSKAAGVGVQGVSTGAGPAGRFTGVLETIGKVPAAVIEGKRTYPTAGLAPAFEQVGQATLKNGRATVKLPAPFDAMIPGRAYHVFLAEYGNMGGLYVSSRREHAFDVRSRRAGANGTFGWRVIVVRLNLRN